MRKCKSISINKSYIYLNIYLYIIYFFDVDFRVCVCVYPKRKSMALNNRLNPSHIGTTNRFLHDIMARKEQLPTTPVVMVGGRWWNHPTFQGVVSAVVQAIRKTYLGTQIGDGFFSFLFGALQNWIGLLVFEKKTNITKSKDKGINLGIWNIHF